MQIAMRIILSFFVFVAGYFFVYWLPLSLLPKLHDTPYLPNIISLLIAVALSVFVWKKTYITANGLVSYIIMGGLIVGAMGFILGFFGPILFSLGGNQGPLLGIFLTGPLGFIIGLVGGAFYWKMKRKKQLAKL